MRQISSDDCWIDDVILRPFQLYFSHIRTMGGILKSCVQWNPVNDYKKFPPAGLEPGTARSVGHRLAYRATGATDRTTLHVLI